MAKADRKITELVSDIRGINKPKWFLEAYEEVFSPLKDKYLVVMELGVAKGGSIKLWEQYFRNSKIIGVESGAEGQAMENTFGERVEIKKLDQQDKKLADSEYDIIIDDGGHMMSQQIGSFELLFSKLKEGGIYVIEDTETSYINSFIDQPITTIEFFKKLVDSINTSEVKFNSISFYKYLCIIRK